MSDLTVAMPAFEDDPAVLRRVLDAASAQVGRPIVVVDMSRTDAVAGVAGSREDVVYVPFRESRGVSHSRNECVRRAETRYVLFLDSDAVPEPGWASAARAGFEHDRVAIVGTRVVGEYAHRPPRLFTTATASDWLSMLDLGDEPGEVPRVMGTSYAIDRERLGDAPFDEALGRSPGVAIAHEEVQLALDAARAGWRCWYAADARVRHLVDASRLTWRWMMRRAYTAGREVALAPAEGLEPLPRRLTLRDHVFRALVAPAFLAGRVRGPQ
jgi:GT2 family glycosyltransferase